MEINLLREIIPLANLQIIIEESTPCKLIIVKRLRYSAQGQTLLPPQARFSLGKDGRARAQHGRFLLVMREEQLTRFGYGCCGLMYQNHHFCVLCSRQLTHTFAPKKRINHKLCLEK